MAKTVRTVQGNNEEILATLAKMESEDKVSESTWKWGCGVAVIAGAIPFFIGLTGAKVPPVMLGLCLVLLVIGVIVFAKGHAGDIDDSRYQALQRLHRFLSGDCAKDAHYRYVLDLRPYDHRGFYSHQDKFGGMFSLPRGKIEYFECPVIHGQVELRDGTALVVEVNRSTRKTTRTKRGYSGKTKTKVKSKASLRYSLKAKLPKGVDLDATQHVSTPSSHRLVIPTPKKKAKDNKIAATSVQKNCQAGLDIEGLLQLLTHTFRHVHQVRQNAT